MSTDEELLNQSGPFEEPVSRAGPALVPPMLSLGWGAAGGGLPQHRHGRGSIGRAPAADLSSRASGSIGGTCQVPPLSPVCDC